MKRRWLTGIIVTALAAGLIAGCGKNAGTGDKKDRTELNVLAAASLTDAFSDIAEKYEAENNVKLIFHFDSSGTLKTQIEEGAPADVFVSAAEKQMAELKEAGLMSEDTIIDLLENQVVLIRPAGSGLKLSSFCDVAGEAVSMVAIGNSDVPAGQYAEAIYTKLGLWDQIRVKANLATNVRQVLDWVATKNVDCGIVYATDAKIEPQVEVVCEAPEGSCDPVIYPAGVVRSSEHEKEAGAFVKYLKSEEAAEILENYGFTMYIN